MICILIEQRDQIESDSVSAQRKRSVREISRIWRRLDRTGLAACKLPCHGNTEFKIQRMTQF